LESIGGRAGGDFDLKLSGEFHENVVMNSPSYSDITIEGVTGGVLDDGALRDCVALGCRAAAMPRPGNKSQATSSSSKPLIIPRHYDVSGPFREAAWLPQRNRELT
jgi:hypothetical protein